MNPITEWALSIVTNPPAGTVPPGQTFGFQVSVKFANAPQFFPLRVVSLEEFMAIAAIFQITSGKLFFNQVGGTLIRTHAEG